jgi:hypothetical protein
MTPARAREILNLCGDGDAEPYFFQDEQLNLDNDADTAGLPLMKRRHLLEMIADGEWKPVPERRRLHDIPKSAGTYYARFKREDCGIEPVQVFLCSRHIPGTKRYQDYLAAHFGGEYIPLVHFDWFGAVPLCEEVT